MKIETGPTINTRKKGCGRCNRCNRRASSFEPPLAENKGAAGRRRRIDTPGDAWSMVYSADWQAFETFTTPLSRNDSKPRGAAGMDGVTGGTNNKCFGPRLSLRDISPGVAIQ